MKIAFYARVIKKETTEEIKQLIHALHKECDEVFLFSTLYELMKDELQGAKLAEDHLLCRGIVDYCVSLGGDGSFLDAATKVAHLGIPLIGVNFGRLGFLTDVSILEGHKIATYIKSQQYHIEQRSLLQISDKNDVTSYWGNQRFAINEITLSKKDVSTLISLEMCINGKHTHTYWADGVIISTPTGSTGYNLSCGGPIVFPSTNCFIITPYASHNLNVRPLVVADDVKISFHITCRTSNSFICTLDSRRKELTTDTIFFIEKEKFPLSIVRLRHYDFIDALTQKLHWGLDVRNT